MLNRLISLLLFSLPSFYATAQKDYYWVGGSGNWSDSENHWATSSGGSEFHASEPSASDNVYFDENSFTEPNQLVTLDLEDAYCHDMDWSEVIHPVKFISHPEMEYTGIQIEGSTILNEYVEFDIIFIGFFPNEGTITIDPAGGGFGNSDIGLFLSNGSISLLDSLSAGSFGFVNMFHSFDANENPIHLNEDFALRLSIFSLIDLSNSTIYTKNFRVTSAVSTANGGQLRTTNTEVKIIYPEGRTEIDKTRHPNPIVKKYSILEDHSIMNNSPVFDELVIGQGVELIVHDFIDGIEFQNIKAEGLGAERITIKSFSQGSSARLIQSEGEANFSLVDFMDIEATGGAIFKAYGSRDLGNVSGIEFLKADQVITFEIDNKDFEDLNESFELSGISTSGLALNYESSNEEVAIISGGNEVLIVGLGTTQITASQEGDDSFFAAEPVIRVLEVNKANQSITFEEIADVWIGESFLNLEANTTSGLEIDFQVSGPATLEDQVLELEGPGTVQVIAKQAGNENYFEAEDITRTFEVYKRDQTITFDPIADQNLDDESLLLTATSSVDLPITYEIAGPVIISEDQLRFTGTGKVELTAAQSGNELYSAASEVSQSFEIYKILGLTDESEIIAYPNPVSDMLTVNWVLGASFILYDHLGKTIFQGNAHKGQVDMSRMKEGQYYLKAVHGSHVTIQKIVKE